MMMMKSWTFPILSFSSPFHITAEVYKVEYEAKEEERHKIKVFSSSSSISEAIRLILRL